MADREARQKAIASAVRSLPLPVRRALEGQHQHLPRERDTTAQRDREGRVLARYKAKQTPRQIAAGEGLHVETVRRMLKGVG